MEKFELMGRDRKLARWERGKGNPDANHELVLNRFLSAW